MSTAFSEIHMLLIDHCDSAIGDEWEQVAFHREGLWANNEAAQIEWITGFFSALFQRKRLVQPHHCNAIEQLTKADNRSTFLLAFKTYMVSILNEENIRIF